MKAVEEIVRNPDAPTLRESLDWQAAHQPDKRAFVYLERGERETESWTFAQLRVRARTIAAALQQHELGGQRVVLAYTSGLEFVAALFGCFYAGAIAVPSPVANYGNSFERVRTILSDAEAAAVLSVRALIRSDVQRLGEIADPRISNVRFIATDEIPNSNGFSVTQPAETNGLAMLQYTSGSTGNPRGVMITHSNLMHNLQTLSRALDSGPGDVGVTWLPLHHDMGLIGGVLHTVYKGGFCAVMPPLAFIQKPIRWLKAIGRYRATISGGPCFAYDLCAQRYTPQSEPDLDLSSWRAAVCGGETVRPQLLEKFTEAFRPAGFSRRAVLPAFGLAEATLLATTTPLGTGMKTRTIPISAATETNKQLACCGYTSEGQRIAIVNPASGHRIAPGEIGEIWLQGPSVAAGYWNRSEETRVAFQAQLADEPDSGFWLRTGDLGFQSTDGLVVTGRRKEIVMIRGANYDPLDIEAAACETDPALSTAGAAAFSIDQDDGEAVVLVLEIERSAMPGLDIHPLVSRIAAAVNRRFGLTIYDLVLLTGRIPRTTSGKIQRNRCRELYLGGGLAAISTVDHPALGRCRPQAREFA